ncbi:ankyrin-1 [Phialemonium atrogriseum]|uniref:protein S-acyltransferase n=1 Tax=Phialemonium atrogriseum TaxID=1093897 RepID=A0AAJ0FFF0_9PEZI|nr:ankyrin-1 [Phialemonium atrogriseum]KAK1766526.1 ankyrin-1 [Phialemonium atrogriseum]
MCDPLSIATGTASLLAASLKLSHGLIVLRSRFQKVPETVSGLCNELQLTSIGLDALTSASSNDQARRNLLQCVEATTVSMAKSFSVLDTEIAKLNKDDPAESQSVAWRLRFMWVESDLNGLMVQVRDQRSSLSFLMQVVQTAKIHEIHRQFQGASPGLAALRRTATIAKGSSRPIIRPDPKPSAESCTPELQKILKQDTKFPDFEDINQPGSASKPSTPNTTGMGGEQKAKPPHNGQPPTPVPSPSFPAVPYAPSAKVEPTLVHHELHYAVTNNDIGRVPSLLDGGQIPLGLPSNPYGTLPNASKTSLSLAAYLGRDEILLIFLQRGFGWAVNECIGKDLPPLLAAAYAGRESSARILLSKGGANPRLRGYGNNTSLFWASARGHENMVNLLLQSGAADDINFANDKGLTPLMVAAQHGHHGVVEALLARGADVHAVNSKQQSAIHLASHSGHLDIVSSLLSHGAALNSATANGKTPLIFAAAAGFADVADLLASSGALINLADSAGCTALYHTARGGYSGAAEVLLDRYAATEATTRAGDRALHAACECGHARVVGLLLAHGARLDAVRASDGLSALDVAAWHRRRNVLGPLILFRAKQNPVEFSTRDALYAAAKWGLGEVVDALVEAGADVDEVEVEEDGARAGSAAGGQSLLARASREGNVDAARLLIEKGADVNRVDCYGASPLHRVAMAANVQLARLLVEAGAKLDCVDKSGRTAAQVADMFGSQEMRDFFRSCSPA